MEKNLQTVRDIDNSPLDFATVMDLEETAVIRASLAGYPQIEVCKVFFVGEGIVYGITNYAPWPDERLISFKA